MLSLSSQEVEWYKEFQLTFDSHLPKAFFTDSFLFLIKTFLTSFAGLEFVGLHIITLWSLDPNGGKT